MRQLFIDTETTGLSPRHGHRVIEIACVEMVDGRLTGNDYHVYLDPERSVPAEAEAVHGLNDSFLLGQPLFSDVAPALMAFIADAHVLIHNAPFDVRFFAAEFERINIIYSLLTCLDSITDTLTAFRKLHPGQSCALKKLCNYYDLGMPEGRWHSALTDAQMLARLWSARAKTLSISIQI